MMGFLVIQGLGGHVVTQGWTTPQPLCNLVFQGLCGPSLVVQGLSLPAGAAPAASGGMAHGGAAAPLGSWSPSSAGGHALGGAAAPRQSAAGTAAGGIAQGGAAPFSWLWSPSSAGGLALGGAARLPRHETVAAGGGLAHGGCAAGASLVYAVYGNAGLDDPIDYATPLAVLGATTWTSAALAVPGSYRFGVRARDAISGLEEENLDAAITLVLDAQGNDTTLVPPAPVGVRGFALAAGAIRVEWSCPCLDPRRAPDGFHVYLGPGAPADGAPPAATVPASDGTAGTHAVTLDGLTDRVAYGINVRAYNRFGEEKNTLVVVVTADGTPPAVVDGLAAAATAEDS
jgi:hypothetical protein